MFALNRILIPTNLGETSRAALKYGVAFARQFSARLYIVHILPPKDFDAAIETERVMETLMPGDGGGESSVPDAISIARNAAREDMGRLLDSDEQRDVDVEYLLRSAGRHGAGEEILAAAKEFEVELIVMGKHRQGFVDHLLAGSVTEKVVRDAPCPVLIVHYPEQEFVVDDQSLTDLN